MKIRVLVAMAGVLFSVTAIACSEDADAPPIVTPTVTAAESSPYATSATEPTPTPHATPIAAPATLDGCPLDDAALCEFALNAQDALNVGDMGFLESRLTAQQHQCIDVGCPDGVEGTSVPVVGVLGTHSDCCFVPPDEFSMRLQERLDLLPMGGVWRVYGIERRTNQDRIVVVRGNGQNALMVSIGTVPDGSFAIPDVIVGGLGGLYIFPDSEFFPWP